MGEEAGGGPPAPTDLGAGPVREALKARLRRSRRTARDLERELGLGHGTVGNVLRGRSELSFRHLALFSRALGFTLPELFVEAYGLCQPDELQGRIAQAVRAELTAFWDQHGSRIEQTLARIEKLSRQGRVGSGLAKPPPEHLLE